MEEKKLTYNDIYFILTFINDLSTVKLPTKAMTEKLLLRAHYLKPLREFEDFKQTTHNDENADEEAKNKAITEKLNETVEGFTPRYFTTEAFEQIVGAVSAVADENGEIKSLLNVQTGEDGKTVLGSVPFEAWLQSFVEVLVKE